MMRAILFALVAGCIFPVQAGIRAVTPAPAWGSQTNEWRLTRHLQKLEQLKKNPPQVVFLGDSITHFWETTGSYVWNKYFTNKTYAVANLGTSADRTENLLWRIENGELDGYEAKCVLIMIGTNNAGHFPIEKEPPINTIYGIRKIVERVRAKQPKAKIVLTAIFPTQHAFHKRNEVVNKEIAKFADGETVFWCDFTDPLTAEDGSVLPEVFPDGLHPGPYGYEVWAAAVKPYIDYAVSEGRLPAPPNRFAAHTRRACFRAAGPATLYPVSRLCNEKHSDWWERRLWSKCQKIADSNGTFDIVMLGDSITHNWESRGKDSFEELSKRYAVLNLGYAGDRVEQQLWRLENGELFGYKAKCFTLLIGTNNHEGRNDRGNREDIVAGLKKTLDLIAQHQPQAVTLLLSIFPRGGIREHSRINNAKVNPLLKKLADGQKVIWVDLWDAFLDKDGSVMWCFPDGVHPSAETYRNIILPALEPHFKKICDK